MMSLCGCMCIRTAWEHLACLQLWRLWHCSSSYARLAPAVIHPAMSAAMQVLISVDVTRMVACHASEDQNDMASLTEPLHTSGHPSCLKQQCVVY